MAISSRFTATSSTSNRRSGASRAGASAGSASTGSASARGRVSSNQKVAPSPGVLSQPRVPPISSTMRLQMARPRPVPPYWRETEASAWVKRSNRWSTCSRVTPMPLSLTAMRRRSPSPCAGPWVTVTVTPPAAVNLMALERKFSSTWRMRVASPTRGAISPWVTTARSRPLALACSASSPAMARAGATGSKGRTSSWAAPASSLE